MVGQALLDFSPCCVSDFRPDLSVKCVCQILCSSASVGGDGVVHSVQVDGLPEHLLCYADMIFVIFFTQADSSYSRGVRTCKFQLSTEILIISGKPFK